MGNIASGVSVLVAAYNAEATVRRAVRSALDQSSAQEVLVFDDGSHDATAEVARGCDDGTGRLRVFRSDVNVGPSAARNRLITESRAPLICVLDADDFMRLGRLDALLAAAGGEDWDLLADDLEFVEEHRETVVLDRLLRPGEVLPRLMDASEFVLRCLNDPLRPRRELAFAKPLIRREFLLRNALRYEEGLRLGEDYLLYAGCLLAGARLKLVEACGYVAVQREGSLSGSHTTADLSAFLAADIGLQLLAPRKGPAHDALVRHARQLRRNRDFRRMVDLRREGRFGKLIRTMVGSPDSTGRMIVQIIRDRVRAW